MPTDDSGTTTPGAPAPGAGGAGSPGSGGGGTTTTPPGDGGGGLGPQGEAALREERAARAKAEREAAQARDELAALKATTQTDAEKAIETAKAAGRSEALAEANARLVRAEIRAAAGGKFTDPGDVPALLGDLDRFVDKKGEVDPKAISSAIDDLLKAKPYLGAAAPGSKPGALPGGGKPSPTGISINDDIRARAGRG